MEGVSIVVSWCTVLSFSTSLMTSARVWGSFSYILNVIWGASLRPLTIFEYPQCHYQKHITLSQHFPVLVASQTSVQVRPCDLALARHVWLYVRMSVVFSISMNQSSNFEESCPSNVGISWSMAVVRLDSLCCVQGVCVHLHGLVHWFLTELGAGWIAW